MATRELVAKTFFEKLQTDSEKQVKKAKELWHELPLNFFYFPGVIDGIDEDGVDLAVTFVTKKVAAADGIDIPANEIDHLINVIDVKTKVDDAITLIHLATFQPPRL